jgi:cytochrome c
MRNSLFALASFFVIATQLACTDERARASSAVTGGDYHRGQTAISHYGCGSCHTVKGIANARGLVGPPLTGLRNRMFVAGMLTNNPENLEHWIQKPKSVNPHTAMPELGVTGSDAADIAAYLYTLN